MSPNFLPSLPALAFSSLALFTFSAPVLLQAQTVSVTAPENGDRIVPGNSFVISASATGSPFVGPPNSANTSGPVTKVDFYRVPNQGQTNAKPLPVLAASNAATAVSALGTNLNFISVLNGGSGYATNPAVTISNLGGGPVTNTTAVIDSGGVVTSIFVPASGFPGFTNVRISVALPSATSGIQATAVAGYGITVPTFLGGSGYDSNFPPPVTIDPPNLAGGTQATADAQVGPSGAVTNILVTTPGSGYTAPPSVTLPTPGGIFLVGSDTTYPFSQTATLPGNDRYTLYAVASFLGGGLLPSGNSTNGPVVIGEQGTAPTVVIVTPQSATATAAIGSGTVTNVNLVNKGTNYTTNPSVFLVGGGGTNASAIASINATTGQVTNITTNSVGSGYTSAPSVLIAPPSLIPTRVREQISINAATGFIGLPQQGDSVAQVDYYVNGILSNTVTAAPYLFNYTPQTAGYADIFARATTSRGITADSGIVTYNVTEGTPPTVSITTPSNGLKVPQTPLTVAWNASDTDGSVVSVELLVNGVAFGVPSTSASGAVVYTPSSAGSYVFVARATDNLGNVTDSTPVTVTIDNTVANPLPSVNLLPQTIGDANYVLGSQLYFNATAVARTNTTLLTTNPVSFSVISAAGLGSVNAANSRIKDGANDVYSAAYEFTPVNIASSTLFGVARATNNTSATNTNVGTSAASVLGSALPVQALPSVEVLALPPSALTNPVAGGMVQLRAKAAFPGTNVANNRVEFYAGGAFIGIATNNTNAATLSQFTHVFNWTTPTNTNNFQVTARAVGVNFTNATTSFFGSSLSANSTSVNLSTNAPPTVSITTPATNNAVVGVGISNAITATATAAGSASIREVQFYLDGIYQASVTNFPYTFNFAPASAGLYNFAAVAIDSFGLQNSSAVRTLSATTGAAPTATLTSPALATNNVNVGQNVTLEATASDTDGSVAQVDFVVNGLVVNTDTTAPYRFIYPVANTGRYEVVARATDNLGNVFQTPVKVLNATIGAAPTARITSPTGGSTIPVGRAVTILADAAVTGSTITTVEFFVNGRSVGTSTQAPYSAAFTPLSKGDYDIYVVAETASGSQGASPTVSTMVVDANPAEVPVVTILSPRAGQTFPPGSNVTVLANAVSPSFTIDSVSFYVNDVLQGTSTIANSSGDYSQLLSLPSQGNYFLKVVAADRFGNTGFAESVITSRAGSGAAPVVRLTVPARDTDYVLGSEIYLNATATDADGTVTGVKFFANNVEIKDPLVRRVGDSYSLRWRIPAADQTFVLHATGTDNRGNSTSSDPVTVQTAQRLNPLPTLTMLAPLAPSAAGQPLTLRARAEFPPAAAGESTVQFYANGVLVGTGQATAGSNVYTYGWTPPAGVAFDDLGAVASAVNYTAGRTYLGARLAQSTVGKDQPVVNSPPAWTAAVGLVSTYRITASNGPLVSFTARQENGQPLPIWMTFDAATGIVTATPPRATTTPLKLRVTATNLGGVTSAPFIITFTALVAPAITSSSTWDLIVGQANSYQILTSVPATSYTLLGAMPSWVTSFNNRTGLITANPAASIANTVLQLTAGNAAGAGPVFNLTARTPVPIVSGPATVIASPGITTTARMSASNSPTSWAKKSGPAWVTVSPQGLLSALPPSGGRFTAVVTASNAYGPSPDFTVTIDATTPPGSPVATFNTGAGANAPVFSVVPDLKNPNGLLYVAGNFTQYAGKPAVRLARVKADGSLDSTFNPGAGPNAVVRAVAVQPADERVLVGGEFTSFNGNFAGRLVRLSRTGAVDTSFVIGTGANAPIRAIVVQKDGKILLAGDFTLFNGQPAPYLARLNANGSMDTTFKPGIGPNGRVNALALASNGSIYIGGWFGGVGGKDASRIARLSVNGTFDPTFQTRGGVSNTAVSAAADPFTPGIGTTGTVNALAVTSSGRLLVGGDFNTAAGDVPSYRLAAFESTGLVVREFSFNGPASAPVDALVALSGGRVMAGGSFRFIGSPAQSRPGIAALSATGVVEADFRSPLNPAPRSALSSVALQPNGNILIGGSFISVQGATQTRVGMLYSENKTTLIARVGRPFRHAVSAASGARSTPPTFRVAKGSKLPPGLRLAASTGVITGTPTAAGIYNLTIQVNGGGSVRKSAFTVVVRK